MASSCITPYPAAISWVATREEDILEFASLVWSAWLSRIYVHCVSRSRPKTGREKSNPAPLSTEFREDMLPSKLANERTDWALMAIGKSPDEFQISKQADVLTLFYLLPEHEVIELLKKMGYSFDYDSLHRTALYYLARTTHRSSLSYVVYSGALAHVDLQESWNLFLQVLNTDLNPLKGKSIAVSVHLGAMGGSIDILQRRYRGIAACIDGLHVNPLLPPQPGKVRMRILYRGNSVDVETGDSTLHISSISFNASDVSVIHQGQQMLMSPGESIEIAQVKGRHPHAEGKCEMVLN